LQHDVFDEASDGSPLPNYALAGPLRGRKICAKSAHRHCTYFSVEQRVHAERQVRLVATRGG
jgi:hypothetical protein